MLTVNDRLVHERASGWYNGLIIQMMPGASKYWTNASKGALMERLGRYEDTGLTPEEIEDLKKKLRELNGES